MYKKVGIGFVGLCLLTGLSQCTAIREFLGFGYKPPQVELAAIDVANISFTSLGLVVTLKVTNPNDYDLTLKKLDYKLSSAGVQVASGSFNETFTAPKLGAGKAKLPVTVEVQSAVTLVKDFLESSESETKVLLKADAVFDSPIGEIEKSFEVEKMLKDL